jgi:hypothetical protein
MIARSAPEGKPDRRTSSVPTPAQTHFAVVAVQKLRGGEPINRHSRTREHFGPHLAVVNEMAQTLTEAIAGQESEAAVREVMEVFWTAARLNPQYRGLVAAVDAEDVAKLA